MKILSKKVTELMQTHYNDNYTQLSKAMDLDPSNLHRALKRNIGSGNKVISAVIKFCREKVFLYIIA